MKVAIVGGGLCGLGAAYALAKAGHQTTVFEAQPQLGGQVATFDVGGEPLEIFYHHMFTGDTELLDLLRELGLIGDLEWLDSKVGFFSGGHIYPFVTPLELLRFSPLSLPDRVRLGLLALRLRGRADWQSFEGTTAKEWIKRRAGQRNYDVVWGPLLRGKFGERADDVSMVWFWGKIRVRFTSRQGSAQRERLGYLRGSFGRLVTALEQATRQHGGEARVGAPARRIVVADGRAVGVATDGGEHTDFDAVVATVPNYAFLEMAPDLAGDYAERLRSVAYQGAMCLALTLKRSVMPTYWLNIGDAAMPFVAAIEHTNLISPQRYGGKRVLYLSNYVTTSHRLWQLDADALLAEYVPGLRRLNPAFDASWVEGCRLFKDASGQPVVTTHYSRRLVEHQAPITGLYLANTAQIYPQDRGMNYALRLGRQVAELIAAG